MCSIIGWELVEKTVTMDGGNLPDFARPTPRHWQHQVLLNPFLYSVLAEEVCLRWGVTIHYYPFEEIRRVLRDHGAIVPESS